MYGPYEYSEECFGHSEGRPGITDFELGRDSVWYETIIETGFMCYFILYEYLEIEGFEPIHMELIDAANMKRAAMAKKLGFLGKLRALVWLIMKESLRCVTWCWRKSWKQRVQARRKRRMAEDGAENDYKKKNDNEIFMMAFKFYAQHSATIEIFRDNRLERIPFFLPSYYMHLHEGIRAEYEENVDRLVFPFLKII